MIVCYRFRWRSPLWLAAIAFLFCPILPAPALAQAGDVGFADRHPRLLFSSADLPAIRARVLDGGVDDAAYAFIREQATNVYPGEPLDSLVRDDGAQEPIANLMLVSHFEASVDSEVVNLGRRLTLYIARNFAVNTDPW